MIQPEDVAKTVLYLLDLSSVVVVRKVVMERAGGVGGDYYEIVPLTVAVSLHPSLAQPPPDSTQVALLVKAFIFPSAELTCPP